jgi:hypothetical protein
LLKANYAQRTESLKGKVEKTAPAESGASLELEVDVNRIGATIAQARRRRIDLEHAMGRRHHRIVHDDISARFQNLHVRNLAVGLDPDLQGANEGL